MAEKKYLKSKIGSLDTEIEELNQKLSQKDKMLVMKD